MPKEILFWTLVLLVAEVQLGFVQAGPPKDQPKGPRLFIKNYTSQRRNFILFHSNPKQLLKRHPVKQVARKAQVTQASSNGAQLDSLLQSALSNTGSNTTIVIINRTPALVPKMSSVISQVNEQNHNDGACKNNPGDGQAPTRSYMTLDDISGLVNVTRSIGELYDGYYKIFPNKDEVLSDSKGSSIIDNTANILSFYGKVKRFVVAVLDEKNNLNKDLETIRTKVNTLQTSQMDMLRFLGLDKRYSQVKLRTAAYEGYDPKFSSYYMDIVDTTLNFQINVQTSLRTVADLDNYTRMFISAVRELANLGINKYNSQFMNILDKIDTVLMFLATLVQLKVELENGIKNMIDSLKVLGSERQAISSTLQNLQNLAEFYELQGKASNSLLTVKSAWRTEAVVCLLLPVLLVLK